MRIPLCRCQPRSQPQPQFHNKTLPAPAERQKGQILVIFAGALIILLFFIGLALDAGSLYVTYGNLKRAVDSAAVAAANEFKRDAQTAAMVTAANEVLGMMNVDYTNLELLLCDGDNDHVRDTGLPPIFEARCPDTANGEDARKLVWVKAEQQAPLYFLSLLGFNNLMISTNTISEAAPLDVVIVLDTSESMAFETTGFNPNAAFDPSGCNATNTCEPMAKAKAAAIALIDTLADGYDQVAVVTFDSTDHVIFSLDGNLGAAKTAINAIGVHDDPPVIFNIWASWYSHAGSYNPTNSEDLDGDGLDADNPAILGYTCPFASQPDDLEDRWWSTDEGSPDPHGWGGVPCDQDGVYDSMDWNGDSIWTIDDHNAALTWAGGDANYKFTGLSTCSGCGLRQGSNQLKGGGRFGSVWVMVFLSDGAVNLSDTHAGNDQIPVGLKNGFCGGALGSGYWTTYCRDNTMTPRYCFDTNASTCPPGSTHVTTTPQYSVLDYALDMVDETALTKSTNTNEPRGNEIAIYSIGLNVDGGVAEQFLRYVAAVGDDGDRVTDPCASTTANTSCGQYYYAPGGARLYAIFEDIASRIYTRISQ
jgi:hypothetical protein